MIARLIMAVLLAFTWRCIAPATHHNNPLRDMTPEQREEALSMAQCNCEQQPCMWHSLDLDDTHVVQGVTFELVDAHGHPIAPSPEEHEVLASVTHLADVVAGRRKERATIVERLRARADELYASDRASDTPEYWASLALRSFAAELEAHPT